MPPLPSHSTHPHRHIAHDVSCSTSQFLRPSYQLINPSILHSPNPFPLLVVHPSSRDTLVRRPQLLHFRPFRHICILPCRSTSYPGARPHPRTILSMLVQIHVCASLAAEGIPPSGFGRPPPLPAMSRCPPGPRESAPSADLVWPRTNALRMLAGSARTYAPRYAHLNMPFALPKIDLFRCVPRPTSSSWLRSPWVPMAALRFDCAPPW